ncbi:hypothetical protein cce_1892 [Crocosphaera subtropica ATCC 51142]|uniref:Ribbon-helix-helix protein CopG domain-containing protein n=1 Tax=Crocosphaera subtropica (strain ATCC 51142 / BH68) TaxID=43989 RepID=B1X0F3_CROS5|nr:hypothetical protein [Crocosphaera subtropica]ACB51242.1 hypothetical protein cce_1892 [Crocosphaera subtropica ATCC 51142]
MARTKPRSDKVLTIRLPERDLLRLESYCMADGKTKTEVIRQFIHSLPVKESSTTEQAG